MTSRDSRNFPSGLGAAILMLSVIAWREGVAADQKKPCAELASLGQNGSFKRYGVNYDKSTENLLIYKVDIDNDGRVDEIEALCGNGSGATCEITANFGSGGKVEFGLPATIRLLRYRESVCFVNGVIIDRGGKASFSGYTVHRVSRRGVELICGNQKNAKENEC